MEHYDPIEWILYKEGVFPREKMVAMEEHLYMCDECLETFTPRPYPNIMKSIENIRSISNTNRKKSNKAYRDMFIYYTGIASVTIVLALFFMGWLGFSLLLFLLPLIWFYSFFDAFHVVSGNKPVADETLDILTSIKPEWIGWPLM